MARDNEKIIELLHDAQKYHKAILKQLIDADASPEILSAVVDAMGRLSSSLNDGYGCGGYIRAIPSTVISQSYVTEDILAQSIKLSQLIGEAVAAKKAEDKD